MPYAVDPITGIRIGEIVKAADVAASTTKVKLGTSVAAEDGHVYIFAQASGAIADAATAILTEPAMTAASGAGAWTNTNGAALAAGDRAWLKKTAI